MIIKQDENKRMEGVFIQCVVTSVVHAYGILREARPFC